MKKVLFVFLIGLMLSPIVSYSQSDGKDYRSDFKYLNVFSNAEFDLYGIYSYSLSPTHLYNFGAGIGAHKRLNDYFRIRGIIEVNGFILNQFDRAGKGMIGLTFDLLPFYMFVDYGANLNPSMRSNRFGLAMDGGIGLQFKLGSASLFLEGAVDRMNNGTKWQSNVEFKAGVRTNLGVMESDRVRSSADFNMRCEYGELKHENQLLKTDIKKCNESTQQMAEIVERTSALLASMEAKYKDKEQELEDLRGSCSGVSCDDIILFEVGSSKLSKLEDQKLQLIADKILQNPGTYTVKGYSSIEGNDYNNQKLSERRAWVVCLRLEEYGVNFDSLIPSGEGATEEFSDIYEFPNRMVLIKKLN